MARSSLYLALWRLDISHSLYDAARSLPNWRDDLNGGSRIVRSGSRSPASRRREGGAYDGRPGLSQGAAGAPVSGAQVTPSIKAVPLAGHTPGHRGYEIVSGEDRLLYIGDAMHSSVISVQRPEWRNGWDSDNAAAVATRQDLLERGVTGTRRIYGVHFPFPGVGRFQRRDDGFVWVPEAPRQP